MFMYVLFKYTEMWAVWIIIKILEILLVFGWILVTFVSKFVMESHFTYVFSHMEHEPLEVVSHFVLLVTNLCMCVYVDCCVHKQLNHDPKTDSEVDLVPYCIGHVNYVEVNAVDVIMSRKRAHANFLSAALYT